MEEKNTDLNVKGELVNESLTERHFAARKNRKKIIIITVAVITLAVIAGFAAVKLIGKSGYNGAVEEYMDAFVSKDHKAVTDQLSSYYSALKLSDISIADNIKYFNKVIDNAHSSFSENLGKEYTVEYEITSVDKMGAKEFNAMVNALSFGAYNAKSVITEALRAEILITAKTESGSEMTHSITLLLTNEEGKWLILNIE